MITEEIRSYEVSLWTLQDEFITVLKWSDVEQRDRIRDPQMKINIDGTLELSFSIPMYLYYMVEEEGKEPRLEKKENPIWYNTLNGNLIVGLRKVKVIFNKGAYDISEASKHIFEFIITKITESHESDLLICNITCEGLAFHELGKIGYKLSLSQDTYILNKEDWDKTGTWTKYDGTVSTEEPLENVLYWCELCGLVPTPENDALIEANKWYYDILMKWDSFNKTRSSNMIYEDEYVSSWSDTLVPQTVESAREKLRPISINESNIYNITLTIAETFKIYCRYEYGYDDNYHIISRKVIFYNNYLLKNDVISFTYPYTSSQITRDMDVTDLTTKMYVRSQDDTSVVSGQINIADCPSNRSKEDYILNFDYLYQTGAITQELYDEIPIFEKNVRQLNTTLNDLSLTINALDNIIIEQSALESVYDLARILDLERIDYNSALYKELGAEEGYLTRGVANPYSTYVKAAASGGGRYITLSDEDKGVDPTYIMIFRGYNSAKLTFKNYINPSTYSFEYDNGFVSRINFSSFDDTFSTDVNNITVDTDNWTLTTIDANDTATSKTSSLVYLIYKYKPKLYYDTVNLMWMTKYKNDDEAYNNAVTARETAEASKIAKEVEYEEALGNKRVLIKKFELLMGPALREGYWQPENYLDYGDKHHIDNLTINNTYDSSIMIDDTGKGAAVGWDLTLFDDEDKLYYEESVLRTEVKYPCIILNSTLLEQIATWLSANKTISFIFNNNYYKTLTALEAAEVQNLSMFALGGDMHLGFVKGSLSTITPVLVLTGTQSMTNELIKFMMSSGNAKLGIVDILLDELNNNKPYINVSSDAVSLTAANFLWNTSIVSEVSSNDGYAIIYPRIKLSSNELNTSSIILKYNNILLENYTDYNILSRTVTRDDKAYFEYFITIKPHVFFKAGTYTDTFDIIYVLSNAATCIYLDAIGVMLDSSKPRVSYTIDVNILDINYLSNLYNKLAQIVMINDNDLKFENVFGYISELILKLDTPWEDEIEVKNYKTKFEDLFSTIVAQSEEMRKSGDAFLSAASGEVPLTVEAFSNTLTLNDIMVLAYLDSHFDSSEVVKEKLADIFTEAGTILASANNSLEALRNLNIKNASILNGFIENIAVDLTPNVVTSKTLPTKYKVGDVWNEIDDDGNIIGRHVAMSSSEDAAGGYARTFDGTLAAIKGANMSYDAVAGKVDIYGEHKIDLRSGEHIYIAAGDSVDIVGNRAVNIGGTTINIASCNTDDLPGGYITGGINLVSSKISFSKSLSDSAIDSAILNAIASNDSSLTKVLIHPDKIEMGGANIIMKGSNKILMITSRNSLLSTSALSISPGEGVWIGSGQGVTLYSGNITVTLNLDGSFSPASGTGASVELLPTHLLFGVSNTTSVGTAVEMTDNYLVIAAGNLTRTSDITGVSGGLAGAKFTKDSIGFAVESNNVITAAIMNNLGLTFGSGITGLGTGKTLANATKEDLRGSSGSYTRIGPEGIELGSLADLYINTDNFKLLTHSRDKNNNGTFTDGETIMAVGSDLLTIGYDTTISNGKFYNNGVEIKNSSNLSPSVRFLLNKNGAYINGTVYASAGSFTGDVTANTFVATGNGQLFIANSNQLGFYTTASTPAALLTISSSGISAQHGFDISATNIAIKSDPGNDGNYFYTGNSNKYIKYTSAGALEVKGKVIATSFTLSGETALTEFATAISNSGVSFGTDGISTLTWNGGTYVGLTSTVGSSGSNNGILIGVSESANVTLHIIVPYAADNTKTIVDISKNGIYFDHYATAPSANDESSNYIHMDTNGIDVKGNRISINGKEVWGRDDIIFSASEPTVHPTDRDWVWIKPNSNVNSIFRAGIESYQNYTNSTDLRLAANNNNLTYGIDTGHITLTAEWAVAQNLQITSGSTTEITYVADITFYNLSTRINNHFSLKLSASKNGTPIGLTITSSIPSIRLEYKNPTVTSVILALNVTNNLLSEVGATLQFQTDTDINDCFIVGVTITAMVKDAIASNTRVLCDVFYCSET